MNSIHRNKPVYGWSYFLCDAKHKINLILTKQFFNVPGLQSRWFSASKGQVYIYGAPEQGLSTGAKTFFDGKKGAKTFREANTFLLQNFENQDSYRKKVMSSILKYLKIEARIMQEGSKEEYICIIPSSVWAVSAGRQCIIVGAVLLEQDSFQQALVI